MAHNQGFLTIQGRVQPSDIGTGVGAERGEWSAGRVAAGCGPRLTYESVNEGQRSESVSVVQNSQADD